MIYGILLQQAILSCLGVWPFQHQNAVLDEHCADMHFTCQTVRQHNPPACQSLFMDSKQVVHEICGKGWIHYLEVSGCGDTDLLLWPYLS